MSKKKTALIVSGLIFVLLVSAVLIYYFGANYPYYNSIRTVEFKIPGLDVSFVPQGFAYDNQSSYYFVSGYMSDKTASRLYILKENDQEKFIHITLTVEDSDYFGHLGGVAVLNDNIWFASDGYVYRLSKNNVLSAEDGAKIEVLDYFKTGNGADSISVYNNQLWVGEFYKKKKYETPAVHHIKINGKETNRAVAYCYNIDESKEFGLDSTIPVCGLSLPNQTQGFEFTDGKIIVSTSYSIPSSHILVYKDFMVAENVVQIEVFEKLMPVYILSSSKLKQDIEAPSMSEELVYKDGKIFILYESACKKWKLFNRTRITNVHSITIEN